MPKVYVVFGVSEPKRWVRLVPTAVGVAPATRSVVPVLTRTSKVVPDGFRSVQFTVMPFVVGVTEAMVGAATDESVEPLPATDQGDLYPLTLMARTPT